jgi:hypothetical protein
MYLSRCYRSNTHPLLTGADASCIYLVSFPFSLVYTWSLYTGFPFPYRSSSVTNGGDNCGHVYTTVQKRGERLDIYIGDFHELQCHPLPPFTALAIEYATWRAWSPASDFTWHSRYSPIFRVSVYPCEWLDDCDNIISCHSSLMYHPTFDVSPRVLIMNLKT